MCSGECITCPFSFSDKADEAQNYGCLPSPFDLVNMRVHHGKTWACHYDYNKPCVGTIQFLKDNDLPYKQINPTLETEITDWHLYTKRPEHAQKIKLKGGYEF
jgi:hypothetical protein